MACHQLRSLVFLNSTRKKGLAFCADCIRNMWIVSLQENVCEMSNSFPGIMKTCLYNFDLLKPHFYKVKLGFTGVYINLLISAQKHRLWVIVRTASAFLNRLCGSNEYPQYMFWAEIWKILEFFYLKIFSFFGVEIFCIFDRCIFVMENRKVSSIAV